MKNIYIGLISLLLLASGCTESVPNKKNTVNAGNESNIANTDTVNGDNQNLSSIKTAELNAQPSFIFSNQSQLTLQVNLPSLVNEQALLNLCIPLESGLIDRRKCIVQTTLNEGRLSIDLDLAAHHNALILELRKRSDLNNTLIYQWFREQGTIWQVSEE